MIDLHCDTLSVMYSEKSNLMRNNLAVDVEKLRQAKSVAQFFACFVDLGDFSGENSIASGYEYANKLIDFAKTEIDKCNDKIRLAVGFDDYLKNLKNGIISAFLTVEEGGIIGGDINKIDELYNKGIRLITLCWNYENSIGYPNSKRYEIMQKGLKSFGFSVVEKMNQKGMIIDVSHLSKGGFFDVVSHSEKPVIASHSSAYSLCRNLRNLTDEMIKFLSEKGGICGVNFYPFFIEPSGKADVSNIADHIVYMQNLGGEDFVALGSDFDGFSPCVSGLENCGKAERLFYALKARGLSERQIEKIKFSNAERVLKEIL